MERLELSLEKERYKLYTRKENHHDSVNVQNQRICGDSLSGAPMARELGVSDLEKVSLAMGSRASLSGRY